MKEITGNLFESVKAEAICITTNAVVNAQNANVMGAGCAKEAKLLWPGIEYILGNLIRQEGHVVHRLTFQVSKLPPVIELSRRRLHKWAGPDIRPHYPPYHVYSFPTKMNWKDPSPLSLIEKSACELIEQVEESGYDSIVIPRPGCGKGGLSWEQQVLPLLTKLWDDRFYVISP